MVGDLSFEDAGRCLSSPFQHVDSFAPAQATWTELVDDLNSGCFTILPFGVVTVCKMRGTDTGW